MKQNELINADEYIGTLTGPGGHRHRYRISASENGFSGHTLAIECTDAIHAETIVNLIDWNGGDPTVNLVFAILRELHFARHKYPGKNVTFAALVEEVGELAKATFEESAERVQEEAVQVAVMAMRMVLDGDHTFDQWRSDKGLDPLAPASMSGNGGIPNA